MFSVDMRTVLDIPDKQIKILDLLSKKKSVSRAEVIKRALNQYITTQGDSAMLYESAFGIWKDQKLEILENYQQLRSEWDA